MPTRSSAPCGNWPSGTARPSRADQPGSRSTSSCRPGLIALRETNSRQHKLFEQTLTRARDSLQDGFNTFAADTQRAYQQLRQELNGEKRLSQALLQELLEIGQDLENIVAARPAADADA